ncbi:MAG: SLC13 family permease [Nitratireductor sp.]|nr:SLC13 family permease [Nitratireductor sp.]
MTKDQILLFALFALVFVFLVWGRWRYDLVAFGALVVALLAGLVPTDQAFSGFGHPATIIVALVLIVSRGLQNSGAVDAITRQLSSPDRSVGMHISIMSAIGAALSAFMNNVAAMALLMPVDIEAARKAGRAVRATLMPLSFATILGGMVTLIGTPPNIIIAAFRGKALGEPFSMFDFTPVGLAVSIAGIAFVALIGWRLVPAGADSDAAARAGEADDFFAELVVPDGSPVVERKVRELYADADEQDVGIVGVVRNGKRLPGFAAGVELRAGDHLLVEAAATDIDKFRGKLKLEYFGERDPEDARAGDLEIVEAVVPRDSRLEGRSAISLRLRARRGIALLGISRHGRRIKQRVRHEPIRAGDIVLLIGPPSELAETAAWLGVLPLARRSMEMTRPAMAGLAVAIFAAAIAASAFGLVYLATALAAVVVLYVLLDIVPLRTLYENIEWPVIVLLGSMIPLGTALEDSGGTALIAASLVDYTAGMPAWVVLTVLMVVVMSLSDVLNNTATAVIGAPIAVDVANKLGASPDPFLMAVAIAASCAFLTPIGHKNNTLILGPGGYRFGDYWRMGLPLEIIVIAVAIPVILIVFPL